MCLLDIISHADRGYKKTIPPSLPRRQSGKASCHPKKQNDKITTRMSSHLRCVGFIPCAVSNACGKTENLVASGSLELLEATVFPINSILCPSLGIEGRNQDIKTNCD